MATEVPHKCNADRPAWAGRPCECADQHIPVVLDPVTGYPIDN